VVASVVAFLQSTEVFQGVDAASLSELAAGVGVVTLGAGDVLVPEHVVNQSAYFVRSGRLCVTGRNVRSEVRVLFDVEPGESVCEMDLFCSDLSATAVTALEPAELLELPRAVYSRFAESHPGLALQVTQALNVRLQRHRLVAVLHLGPIFHGDGPEVLHDLAAELDLVALYAGEVLYRQGDPGSDLYFVISGHMRVSVQEGHAPRRIVAHRPAGQILGEMSVITGKPRESTVEAVRDTQLARLSKEAFGRFVLKHPQWAVQIVSRTLAARIEETRAEHVHGSRTGVTTLAIVPVQPSAPARACCKALASALAAFGQTVHVSSTQIDTLMGQPGISQTFALGGANIRLTEWLSALEIEYSYVIYEADPSPTPWTERCLRQADHILLVSAGDSPDLSEIETELLRAEGSRVLARQWLVLVHDDGANPSQTAKWLDLRNVEMHVHVRLSDAPTFERLARLITNRALGLTLGGGFARGLAHLGVFKATAELGLAIDVIGGASMGAMVGALWAMGWDSERILSEVSAACAGAFGDLTLPFVAFKTGRKFSGSVRALFGDVQIEDLWMPYFCTSANLNRAELKIHTRGSLAKAVLAATRAPGVFPPVIYDGELHVDGGVINNVPVDLMRSFCNDGIVAGVDVSPPHELHQTPDYGDHVSGLAASWKRWKNRTNNSSYMPSILLVMIRTLEYTGISYKNERLKFADIYMYPNLLPFKRTDFHLAAGILQAGYESAKDSVEKWLATEDALSLRPDLARSDSQPQRASVG
jgi:lysophospholipid hydrolase